MGGLGPSTAIGQPVPTSFTLVADASGVTSSVIAPNLSVVDTLVELGGSVAQAELNSLGISQAFAANPTPGELVMTAPGLLAGLSGLPIPNEQFPTTVQSSHPAQPEQTAGMPPVSLAARSEARRSEALATSGAEGIGESRSHAGVHVDPETGASIAEASVEAGPIVIGPVVIGRVTSSARSTVHPDGTRDVTTNFEVGAVLVDGQGATITPDGLVLAGNEVPRLGATTPEELASQGIDVRLIEGSEDPASGAATSPRIEITLRQVLQDGVPGVVPPGQEVILRYVVGRATVGATAVAPTPTGTSAPGVPESAPAPEGPASSSSSSSSPSPEPPLAVSPRTVGAPAVPTGSGHAVTEPVVAPEAPPTVEALGAPRLVANPIDSLLFYPVLVIAAITALLCMHMTTTGSRRQLWRMLENDLSAGGRPPHA